MSSVVNERSTSYLSVSLLDKAGAAAVPASVRYRVDCQTTGQMVRDWTNLAPAAALEIVLTSADNAMVNAVNRSELRRVTVSAVYGVDDEVHNTWEYQVRNLDHVG